MSILTTPTAYRSSYEGKPVSARCHADRYSRGYLVLAYWRTYPGRAVVSDLRRCFYHVRTLAVLPACARPSPAFHQQPDMPNQATLAASAAARGGDRKAGPSREGPRC